MPGTTITPDALARAAERLDRAREDWQHAPQVNRGQAYVRYLEVQIEVLQIQNAHLRRRLVTPVSLPVGTPANVVPFPRLRLREVTA